ncbi:hypothetical protein ACF0H5_000025 [Mactra antiquata]
MMVEQPSNRKQDTTQTITEQDTSPITTTETSTQTSPMQTQEKSIETETTTTDAEMQTDETLPTYTTYYGFSINHPSQIQHMERGGCLYQPQYINTTDYDEISTATTQLPQYENITPPTNYPDADFTTQNVNYVQLLDLEDISPVSNHTPEDTMCSTPIMSRANPILIAKPYDPTRTPRKTPRLNLYREYLDLKRKGQIDTDDDMGQSPPLKKYKITEDEQHDYINISPDSEDEY